MMHLCYIFQVAVAFKHGMLEVTTRRESDRGEDSFFVSVDEWNRLQQQATQIEEKLVQLASTYLPYDPVPLPDEPTIRKYRWELIDTDSETSVRGSKDFYNYGDCKLDGETELVRQRIMGGNHYVLTILHDDETLPTRGEIVQTVIMYYISREVARQCKMFKCEGCLVGSGSQLNHCRNWYDCLTPVSRILKERVVKPNVDAISDMYKHLSTTLDLPQGAEEDMFIQHATELLTPKLICEVIDNRNQEFDHVLKGCYHVY